MGLDYGGYTPGTNDYDSDDMVTYTEIDLGTFEFPCDNYDIIKEQQIQTQMLPNLLITIFLGIILLMVFIAN